MKIVALLWLGWLVLLYFPDVIHPFRTGRGFFQRAWRLILSIPILLVLGLEAWRLDDTTGYFERGPILGVLFFAWIFTAPGRIKRLRERVLRALTGTETAERTAWLQHWSTCTLCSTRWFSTVKRESHFSWSRLTFLTSLVFFMASILFLRSAENLVCYDEATLFLAACVFAAATIVALAFLPALLRFFFAPLFLLWCRYRHRVAPTSTISRKPTWGGPSGVVGTAHSVCYRRGTALALRFHRSSDHSLCLCPGCLRGVGRPDDVALLHTGGALLALASFVFDRLLE